jgi:hypothetical protein
VELTRDRGFLYVCRNGCVDVIKAVNGYDRGGRLVSHPVWSRKPSRVAPGPGRGVAVQSAHLAARSCFRALI